jgi:nucleotide-binding universal stress UspA family protein
MENRRTILVPWDFTPVAEYALKHAVKVAKRVNNEISLVHIVKKKSEINSAEKKLTDTVEKTFSDDGIRPNIIVKEGSIFTTIGEVADEVASNLVIMGTHGIRGMQKLTGSWALKVIVSSKVPFIIVQEPPKDKDNIFENIALPINFKKENKENVLWLNYLADYYKSKFHILRAKNTDSLFKRGVESNVIFTKKYFDSKGIQYDISEADGHKDFSKESVEFASNNDADLILVMTTKSIGFTDYVLGAHEQFIIANSSKIPVMCINPRPAKNLGGFRAGAG